MKEIAFTILAFATILTRCQLDARFQNSHFSGPGRYARLLPKDSEKCYPNSQYGSVWEVTLPTGVPAYGSSEWSWAVTKNVFWNEGDALSKWYQSVGAKKAGKPEAPQSIKTGSSSGKYGADSLAKEITKVGRKGREAVKKAFCKLFTEATKSKPTANRADRGEHLINNDVLALYQDIIVAFTASIGRNVDNELRRRLNDINGRDVPYFPSIAIPNVVEDIRYTLVVHIDPAVRYVNMNTLVYGATKQALVQQAVRHMTALYNTVQYTHNQGSPHSAPLQEIINRIIDDQVFVDINALRLYNGNMATFETAKDRVVRMYRDLYDKLIKWVRDVRGYQPAG